MKRNLTTRIVSLMIAVVLFVLAIPMTAVASTATDPSAKTTDGLADTAPQLTRAEALEKEMAEREAVTKDRSKIHSDSEAAVYVNGELKHQGSFRDMWAKAIALAPITVESTNPAPGYDYKKFSKSKIAALDEVEFVLNKDIHFDYQYSGPYKSGALDVASRKLTIDLNGCMLRRTDFDSELYSGSVINIVNGSVVTIMDSNPTTEHKGKIDDHVWKYNEDGNVVLKGGIITGGQWRKSLGGGIYIDNMCDVTVTGGTITGNRAINGSGVYLGKKSTLDMSNGTSQICYNDTKGWISDGGAIYLSGTDITLKGGYVHHNHADDYGAGILVLSEDTRNYVIDGVVVYANRAEDEGGGIYIEGPNERTEKISNCRVIENYSGERGGGIYVYQQKIELSNCTVEGNCSKEHGGGVVIADYRGFDLTISGRMIVRNNYKSSYSNRENATENSNLYVQGNDDLLVKSLSAGSEIWVRTGKKAESYNGISKKLTDKRADATASYFFADNTEYYVEYQNDPALKNYGCLYLKKGKKPANATVATIDDYKPTVIKNKTYAYESNTTVEETLPIIRGYAEFHLKTASHFRATTPFYYSDGYFFENPDFYNPHLASMSIVMSVAAFGRSTPYIENNRYANHFANVKQVFADIGCSDSDFFANEGFRNKPEYYGEPDRISTIGVAISQKKITADGETYTLIPVAIRGGSYEIEWASNFMIGSEGESAGFSDAANQVYGHVQDYIRDHDLTAEAENGRIKFWVVGYSRAGATANLTSKRLVDDYAKAGNQVFGYTFEAPMGGVKSELVVKDHTDNGRYLTIHNTVNENDFIPLVAPAEMGFFRYGVDHSIGAQYKKDGGINYTKGSAYHTQRQKMVAQLAAINPYHPFDDSWQVADINIVLGAIGLTDFVDKGEQSWDDPNEEAKNIYTFLRWFFLNLQKDGLGTSDKKNFREYYSTRKVLAEIPNNKKTDLPYTDPNYNFAYSELTTEQAVTSLMTLLKGDLEDYQTDGILSAATGNAKDLLSKLTDFGFFTILFDLFEILDFYNDVIDEWDSRSDEYNAKVLNALLQTLLNGDDPETTSIWSSLEPDQVDIVAQALPVVLWFGLNFASNDYEEDGDDGMWGIGTFLNNMDVLLSNHHQELSVAWVRSYDSFYENDLQAYCIDPNTVKQSDPTGSYNASKNVVTLSADPGSSIFYSLNGTDWEHYTTPVTFEKMPSTLRFFSISHGAKSAEIPLFRNTGTGSVFGTGNLWLVLSGTTVLAIGAGVAVFVTQKKKSKKAAK